MLKKIHVDHRRPEKDDGPTKKKMTTGLVYRPESFKSEWEKEII